MSIRKASIDQPTPIGVNELIQGVSDKAVRWRRYLHQNPERSYEEHRTSDFIRETLGTFAGLTISSPTPTFVVARLAGAGPGPTLALRADIDALPILEENEFEFASTNIGTMHACGHDGHTAMLLAAAQILSQVHDQFIGEVLFIFQHAEEVPPGGANELVAAGVMDGVNAVLGCHLYSALDSMKIAVPVGPCMAAADTFSLFIEGRGGHGAFPHQTVDPIAVAAQVVVNLQHVVSRRTNPLDNVVVSVTRIAGGSADNIIPQSVEMGGTVRVFTNELREQTREAVNRVVRGVTDAHDARYEFDYRLGYNPVVNDAVMSAMVAECVRTELGDVVVEMEPVMGGDDFSAYQQCAPGCYFFVGAGDNAAQSRFPHHHPRFTIDERAIPQGITALTASALKFLTP